jgi:hypothetical protein
MFDNTETKISIWMNKGKGFGSVWSICSLFIILSALIFLLFMLGLFNFERSDEISYILGIEQDELTVTL